MKWKLLKEGLPENKKYYNCKIQDIPTVLWIDKDNNAVVNNKGDVMPELMYDQIYYLDESHSPSLSADQEAEAWANAKFPNADKNKWSEVSDSQQWCNAYDSFIAGQNSWANIKSKTFEYRQKVIKEWQKDCEKLYICNDKTEQRANLYANEIVIKYGAVPYIDLHARIKEAVLHGNAMRENSAAFDIHISKDILKEIGFVEDKDKVLCYQNILYYIDEGVFQFAIGYAPLINIRINSFLHLQNLIYWVFKVEVNL